MPTLRFHSDTAVSDFLYMCERYNHHVREIDFTTFDTEDPEVAKIAEQEYGADILPPADTRRGRRSIAEKRRRHPT